MAHALRDHPDVLDFESLHVDDRRAITQYEASQQRRYEFLWASSLPPEFPLVVENGEMDLDFTATKAQFEGFGERDDPAGQTGFSRDFWSVAINSRFHSQPPPGVTAATYITCRYSKSATSQNYTVGPPISGAMSGANTPYPKVLVTKAMTHRVASISADEPATAAARRLTEGDIGSLLVEAESPPPAGIVTESDITRLVADERNPAETPVRECMSSDIVTVDTETTLQTAARVMRDENIKKVPVMEEGVVIGILTTTDIAKYLPAHRVPDD